MKCCTVEHLNFTR